MISGGEEVSFRALFDAAPTPYLVVAPPQWTIVAVNDARLRVTNTTREGQIGRKLFDVFPDDPDDARADGVRNLSASLRRVLATRSTDLMQVQRYAVREPDGRFVERWWTPINSPIFGKDGEVAFILHRVEDVTEAVRLRGEAEARDQLARDQQAAIERLRASEAALRVSEERTRRIVEGVKDHAIFVTDPDGVVVDWTPGAEALFGWPAADIVGRHGDLLFTPEDRAAGIPAQELQTARQSGCANDERWHVRRDGSRLFANGSVRPLHGAAGEVSGFIKIARDETHRRAVEARLRASEELNRRILASSADCIKVLDSEARLEFMSEGGMCVMEVEDFSAIQGAHWPDFWQGDGHAMAVAAVEEARGGGTGRFQGFATTMKGTPRWWDVIVTPICRADGTPEKLLSVSRDVTAAKVSEAALSESQHELQLLADTLPVLVSYIDKDRRYRFINRTYEQWFPDVWRTMQGMLVRDVIGDAAYAAAAPWIERALGGETVSFEQRMAYPGGNTRDIRVDYIPRLADGIVQGFYALLQDVSEQKRAEQALRESEEQLRLATDAAEIGLWDLDVTTDTLFWPPRVKAMFGIAADVPISMADYYAGLHADDAAQTTAAFAAATDPERRALYDVEYRAVGKDDGVVRWVAAKGRGQFDDAGACVRVIGTAIDITARKRIEGQLRELNATLETRVAERTAERDRTWNNARDLLIVLGVDGVVRSVNPAWTTVLGWQAGELAGRSYLEFVHPDDRELTESACRAAGRRPLPVFVSHHRHKDGSYRWISWVAAPEGDLIYASGRDVTADRAREAELEAAQEALRQAQKMEAMGQLMGGVAHDFNNLLTPIVGSLDMLQRKGVGGEREQRLIDGAIQSADRAKTLVQRLLSFARRQPLQAVAVDVVGLVHGMADLIGSTTGPQIRVVVDASGDLPAALADANQLEMALLNLAVNARDAMPDGGTLRLSVGAEEVGPRNLANLKAGRYVQLSVADTGVGMDQATLARAVEPFFSTKGVGRGTGLGLSSAHGLASQLGGGLTIQSRRGVGTNIVMWLPVSAKSAESPGRVPERTSDVVAAGVALLVDDEDLVRMSTADMLGELGYEVAEAASAEQALQMVRSGLVPDVLVTDHLMPGMTGTDLARTIRFELPDLQILLVSGYAEAEGVAPDLARLTKPFRNDELAASLAALGNTAIG